MEVGDSDCSVWCSTSTEDRRMKGRLFIKDKSDYMLEVSLAT